MDNTAPSGRTTAPSECTATPPSRNRARLDSHQLCDHLHDPYHLHHLFGALSVCMINVVMSLAVPSLAVQLLVTVAFFGRDAMTILID